MNYRVRDNQAVSAWVKDCRGAYTHGGETVCPGFWLYRGFVGCPAWAAGKPCTYCFLGTTFRTDPELREGMAWVDASERFEMPRLTVSNARAAVEKWLSKPKSCATCGRPCHEGQGHMLREAVICDRCQPAVLNAGELADSFGFPPEETPHVGMLLDLFSSPETNPHGHKLLLLTKAGLEATRAHLDGRTPSENVILSWSVGNWSCHEPYGETPALRLLAPDWAIQLGWGIRLRLDPLVDSGDTSPVKWFCKGIAHSIPGTPELLTIGALRHRGGRPKLPAEERVSIYREAIEGLRIGGYDGPVGLCKETPGMIREVLGIEPEEMRCNCCGGANRVSMRPKEPDAQGAARGGDGG